MNKLLLVIFILSGLLFAQKSVDITGRVSFKAVNFDYDKNSDIKPDSIPQSEYGKTTLIPGLHQSMNISLFARTRSMDISLLGDIRNNTWNTINFNDQNTIDRLSLSMRFANHEIVLGDFYESGAEFFLQSREVRGGKMNLRFENLWAQRSFLEIKTIFGLVQKSKEKGDHLIGLYKQFESSGQYRRSLAAASISTGETGAFDLGLHLLVAKDDKNSAKESLNDALSNQNAGINGSLFLWKRHIQLFGEAYYSAKDTIDFGGTNDYSFKSGLDFRYEQFKMIAFYQRLGFNYYTAGYPFLLNDRQGLRMQSAYSFPGYVILGLDAEQYDNNLENEKEKPTTKTRITEISATTNIKNIPEFTLLFGFRDDKSNTIFNADNDASNTNRISRKWEARISHSFDLNRVSLSTIFLDLDDNSEIIGGTPLGTEQFIASLNIYSRPSNYFFISGGAVFSRLLLSDSKTNNNYFIYQSSRWDIVPRLLAFESTLNFSKNEAENGDNDDLLNNYWLIDGQVSFEYFFTGNLSLKIIAGTNSRRMNYSTDDAVALLQNPAVDPNFFNGNETYNAVVYGAEINWIF